MPPPTIFFAGGGTGGHIFPAVAIAEELLARDRTLVDRCRFLSSNREVDAEVFSAVSLGGSSPRVTPLHAQPFALSPRRFARFVFSWGPSVRAAKAVIADAKRERSPAVLVATGGFVCAPASQAARVERVPVVLVNLDAVPGKANRWIARRAALVLDAAGTGTADWRPIAPIVRPSLASGPARDAALRTLGLNPSLRTLLVTGGSLGAASINRLMEAIVRERPELFRGWQVVHQAGREAGETGRLAEGYHSAGIPASVGAFFTDMGSCWRSADLAVARGGAGNVAEVWASKVPTLFLPYPYHKDQHQAANTRRLVSAGGAECCRDHVDPARNLAQAGARLASLLTDEPARAVMQAGLASLGPADGARSAASAILGLLGTEAG